jgi:hypothetical protein
MLAKPLLRRFEDSSEQCRELAIAAFSAMTAGLALSTHVMLAVRLLVQLVCLARLGAIAPVYPHSSQNTANM